MTNQQNQTKQQIFFEGVEEIETPRNPCKCGCGCDPDDDCATEL